MSASSLSITMVPLIWVDNSDVVMALSGFKISNFRFQRMNAVSGLVLGIEDQFLELEM